MNVILDVGANIGQSALQFAEWFPGARICCFEPVAATFRQLQNATAGQSQIECLHAAVGADEGTGTMRPDVRPDMSRLDRGSGSDGTGESVRVTTLDAFCRARHIDRVSYLKVDVEGAEMGVLRGGERLFDEQRVDLIELEAGMHARNTHHTPWEHVKAFLEPRGYFLFGIYEQVTEWPARRPELRRANLAFISEAVAAANRSA